MRILGLFFEFACSEIINIWILELENMKDEYKELKKLVLKKYKTWLQKIWVPNIVLYLYCITLVTLSNPKNNCNTSNIVLHTLYSVVLFAII